MVRSELVKRSPLRILENSTHGGVGVGNIGVIASYRGIGKTACLVHIATDSLLQGKHVLHVSFSDKIDHIVSWYEDIFKEVARRHRLEDAMEIHDSIIRNRIILNFVQDGIHISQIKAQIKTFLEQDNFSADTMVVDGYDFHRSNILELREFRALARELGLELWFAASLNDVERQADPEVIPASIQALEREIDVVVRLISLDGHVQLRLLKDHDALTRENLHLKLDPKSLLIAEE